MKIKLFIILIVCFFISGCCAICDSPKISNQEIITQKNLCESNGMSYEVIRSPCAGVVIRVDCMNPGELTKRQFHTMIK